MANPSQKQAIWVILPASGIGSRMQASIPKQYLPLQGKTVIETTLDRLLSLKSVCGVVVVLNAADNYWSELNYQHEKPVLTTIGAAERFGSVLNGLKVLDDVSHDNNLWVMVHDAVRPCVTHKDLQQLVNHSLNESDGLFLAHPVADTLKKADKHHYCVETVDRDQLWRAFTPQMFPYELIVKALTYVMANKHQITDDVSAVEALGLKPKIIPGRSDNIKITYPEDIMIAEIILENQNNS